MANYKNLPISLKIGFTFFLLGLLLLSVLFILLIPKIEKDQYKNALLQTEKMVLLTKSQIDLVVAYFKEYGLLEKNESKKEITNLIDKIKININLEENYTQKNIEKDLLNLSTKFNCNIDLFENNTNLLSLKNERINKKFNFKEYAYDTWNNLDDVKTFCPHPTYYTFKTKIKNQELQLSCSSYFSNEYKNIEQDVKKIVQEGFSLTENIHNGKIYIMWINNKIQEEDLNKSLDTIDNENNKNFCVSKISNYRLPKSGELTIKDILEVENTKNIKHKSENKTTLTWISKIYEKDDQSFIFVLSAFEDDFKNNINSPIIKILPISIVALLISILFGYFLFKRWIKNIDTLSNTARQICLGKLNLRSNIKGNDDVGILGVAFDSMLDKIEDNIKNLDFEVENRTIELSNSLKSKELLLKEIHHRVKNNLSLTINFIKLQKFRIQDLSTKEALSNIENRIYTMSLLHTKLYESKNLDSIDFKNYVEQLIEDIKSTFENNDKIKIIMNIDKVFLDIDYAMPCGLIINEALTNCFKYAFIEKNGVINLSFKLIDNSYILEIKDNGIGLKNDFNLEKMDSLGLNLINSIATIQLNGKLKIINSNGTHLSISFRL